MKKRKRTHRDTSHCLYTCNCTNCYSIHYFIWSSLWSLTTLQRKGNLIFILQITWFKVTYLRNGRIRISSLQVIFLPQDISNFLTSLIDQMRALLLSTSHTSTWHTQVSPDWVLTIAQWHPSAHNGAYYLLMLEEAITCFATFRFDVTCLPLSLIFPSSYL